MLGSKYMYVLKLTPSRCMARGARARARGHGMAPGVGAVYAPARTWR